LPSDFFIPLVSSLLRREKVLKHKSGDLSKKMSFKFTFGRKVMDSRIGLDYMHINDPSHIDGSFAL